VRRGSEDGESEAREKKRKVRIESGG